MPQDYRTEGLRPWQTRDTGAGPLSSLTAKAFACTSSNDLYPTSPSAQQKLYHSYQTASYDHLELDARDYECAISRLGNSHPNAGSPNPDTVARIIADAEENNKPIRCQMGNILHLVYLSDTYIDSCGNYYRGVKQLSFLETDENMGTLWSPGRHTFDTATGQADGFTFAVPFTDFFVLAELLPGDMAGIERLRAAARETHTLDATGRLFLLK